MEEVTSTVVPTTTSTTVQEGHSRFVVHTTSMKLSREWSDASHSWEADGNVDCMADMTTWQQSWPAGKQRWCCEHKGIACTQAPTPAPIDDSSGSPFRCKAGLSNWQQGWSEEKKAWCCLKKRIACLSSGMDDWGAKARETHTTTTGATTTASVTEHPPVSESAAKELAREVLAAGQFDCYHDIAHEASWAERKKNWCCSYTNGQIGCLDQAKFEQSAPLSQPLLLRVAPVVAASGAIVAAAAALALVRGVARPSVQAPQAHGLEQEALLVE